MARKPSESRRTKAPKSLRRAFLTPEGVDLQLELGSRSARAGAFIIDILIILVALAGTNIVLGLLFGGSRLPLFEIIWMLGSFLLFNGWFIFFEMGSRGATPGKRALGLRVVARDGARLTGGAVLARNAVRCVEYIFPIAFLIAQFSRDGVDTTVMVLALAWSGVFLFFPLFNRDRLRIGDMLAGTWVVQTVKADLGYDLVAPTERQRRIFSEAALDLYGVYELQTLENVLRNGQPDAIATVATTIRNKAGLPDDGYDHEFLSDYYAALCARLERGLMTGRRREDKFGGVTRPA